jgi:hypothetical protein
MTQQGQENTCGKGTQKPDLEPRTFSPTSEHLLCQGADDALERALAGSL